MKAVCSLILLSQFIFPNFSFSYVSMHTCLILSTKYRLYYHLAEGSVRSVIEIIATDTPNNCSAYNCVPIKLLNKMGYLRFEVLTAIEEMINILFMEENHLRTVKYKHLSYKNDHPKDFSVHRPVICVNLES